MAKAKAKKAAARKVPAAQKKPARKPPSTRRKVEPSEAATAAPAVLDLFEPRTTPQAAVAELTHVAFAELAPCADNPRVTIDDDGIRELADSIAAQGLLENLVVTPREATRDAVKAEGGARVKYVVVAGERRWRALKLLVAEGKWEADAPHVPVRVLETDALQARAIALLENLQRQDIPPLEEAEAFHKLNQLDPDRWSTDRIAQAVGKTRRFVQQRLQMATRLSPEVRKAMVEGEVTIDQARILSMAPKPVQKELLRGLEWGDIDPRDTRELRNAVMEHYVPVAHALFPLEHYEGEYIDSEDGKERWFASADAFWMPQRAAIAARVADLEATGHKVIVFDGTARNPKPWHSWDWEKAPKKDKDAVHLVVINATGEVEISEHMRKREERRLDLRDTPRNKASEAPTKAKGKGKNAEPAEEPVDPAKLFTKALLGYAHNRRTEALQTAIANDHGMAITMATMGLLGMHQTVLIKHGDHGKDDQVQSPLVRKVLGDANAAIAKFAERDDPDEDLDRDEESDGEDGDDAEAAEDGAPSPRVRFHGGYYGFDQARVLQWLLDKSVEERTELFAALVADACGTFNDYNPPLGDKPVAILAARIAGVDMARDWKADRAYLEKCRKPRLLALADAIAEAQPDMAETLKDLHRKPAKQIVDTLANDILPLAYSKGFAWVPPEIAFGTEAEIRKAVGAPAAEEE